MNIHSDGRPTVEPKKQLLSVIWLLATPDSFNVSLICIEVEYRMVGIITEKHFLGLLERDSIWQNPLFSILSSELSMC